MVDNFNIGERDVSFSLNLYLHNPSLVSSPKKLLPHNFPSSSNLCIGLPNLLFHFSNVFSLFYIPLAQSRHDLYCFLVSSIYMHPSSHFPLIELFAQEEIAKKQLPHEDRHAWNRHPPI